MNIANAWVAGWDASLTYQLGNPYKRREYVRAFERGRAAGKTATADDVRVLKMMLSKKSK